MRDERAMLNNYEESLPLGIFELDVEGRVIAYNTYNSPLRLKTREEIIGRSFFNELLEPACAALEDRFNHVLKQRVPFSRLHFRESPANGQSVLLMFFSDTRSVMIQIDRARHIN